MTRLHHQPVRRADDQAILTGQTLFDGRDMTLDGLTDVDFRGGGYGRFSWTVAGADYYRQYLPPTFVNLSAPPALMVAQMDYVGVDRAVLQTGHSYGRLNTFLSNAVKSFPDRLWALAMVDEWRADHPSQIDVLAHAVEQLGLDGLWFDSNNIRLFGRSEALDDPVFYPFWDRVRDMGIPVYWNLVAVAPGQEPYLAELAAFDRWLDRYPEVPVLCPHGLPLARFMDENRRVSIPPEVWKPLGAPNVIVEILIPIFQGAIWEYPYVEAQPIIREYYERLGPDKLAWGSDMPNVERHCTYKQSLDYLRLHCDFIPQDHMARICGGNVARLFGERPR
jgi:predicted TIM-barrel fold metal-dependent hydrolase